MTDERDKVPNKVLQIPVNMAQFIQYCIPIFILSPTLVSQ